MSARDPRDYEEVSFGSDAQPRSLSSRSRLLIGGAAVCLVVGLRAAYPDDSEIAAEADSTATSAESASCAAGYRHGFRSDSHKVWRDQWMWLVDYNGRPLGRDMAMNLVGSIGEVAAGDRECETLRDFRAHLEQIEDVASAGERIPRRYLLRTAAVGDAWLSAIGEDPVFVEGSGGSSREDRDWPWAN